MNDWKKQLEVIWEQLQTSNENQSPEIFDVWESSEIEVFEEVEETLVDGTYIIGRVVGECFFPDKQSRNKRVYTRKLWDFTLTNSETVERLSSRAMFGTVGHDQEISDEAIREGKVSHIVNRLWLDERGRGMGEFLILGTPSGRNLYIILRAKGKIHFSTRALGKYESTKIGSGDNILSTDGFKLVSVDFVINPGFLEAQPSVVESTEQDYKMTTTSNDFVEHLKVENSSVKRERDDLLAQLSSAEKKLAVYEKLGTVDEISEAVKLEAHKKVLNELKSANAALEGYRKLGTVSSISESLSRYRKYADQYRELGSPEKIKGSLAQAAAIVEETRAKAGKKAESLDRSAQLVQEAKEFISEFGDFSKVSTALHRSHEFIKKHGKFNDISKTLRAFEEFTAEYGRLKTVKEALQAVKSFIDEHGNLEDIEEFLRISEGFLNEAGSFDNVISALEATNNFIEVNGSFDEIHEVLVKTEEFVDGAGGFDDIKEALEVSKTALSTAKEESDVARVKEITKRFKVTEEVAAKFAEGGFSYDEISTILSSPRRTGTGASYLTDASSKTESFKTEKSLSARLMGA